MNILDLKEAEILSNYRESIKKAFQNAKECYSKTVYVSDTDLFFSIRDAKRDLATGKIEANYTETLQCLINKYNEYSAQKQKRLTQEDKKVLDKESKISHKQNTDTPIGEKDDLLICPKCGSINIYVDKKGFSAGKAVIGTVLFGTIGIAAGGIGSNKIICTCLKCGKQFKPEESK